MKIKTNVKAGSLIFTPQTTTRRRRAPTSYSDRAQCIVASMERSSLLAFEPKENNDHETEDKFEIGVKSDND